VKNKIIAIIGLLTLVTFSCYGQVILSGGGGGSLRITNGSNVTFATNTPGVVEITATLVGGAASLADITNVVVSFVSNNATNPMVQTAILVGVTNINAHSNAYTFRMLGSANVWTNAQTIQPLVAAQAITARRGTATQTNNILEIQDQANGFLAGVRSNGVMQAQGFVGSGLSFGNYVFSLEDQVWYTTAKTNLNFADDMFGYTPLLFGVGTNSPKWNLHVWGTNATTGRILLNGTNIETQISAQIAAEASGSTAVTNSVGTAVFGWVKGTNASFTNIYAAALNTPLLIADAVQYTNAGVVGGTATNQVAMYLNSNTQPVTVMGAPGQYLTYSNGGSLLVWSNLPAAGGGVAQSDINSASNALYTTSSNVSVSLANTAMQTSTNYAAGTANNVSNWVNAVSNRFNTFTANLTNADAGILQSATNYTLAQQIASNSLYTPNLVIAKFATNVAWNITAPLGGSVNAITNTLGGSTANLWITNVVDGGFFVARILADGTARTVSVTNASGLTLKVISTNGFSVLTLPQVPITASKLATICGRAWIIAGTTNVDLWANVEQ